MSAINQAYDCLSDPAKRRAYDLTLAKPAEPAKKKYQSHKTSWADYDYPDYDNDYDWDSKFSKFEEELRKARERQQKQREEENAEILRRARQAEQQARNEQRARENAARQAEQERREREAERAREWNRRENERIEQEMAEAAKNKNVVFGDKAADDYLSRWQTIDHARPESKKGIFGKVTDLFK